LDGRDLSVRSIFEAEQAGVFLVPQDLQTVPGISIAANLFLNREPGRFGFASLGRMHKQASALLEEFGIRCDPADPIARLPMAQQQLVIITRAMMHGVKVLALDEPTAALTGAESAVLFAHLTTMRSRGIAILYISHRLDEIARIADRISVLRDGSLVDSVGPGETQTAKRRVVRAMIGRDIELVTRTEGAIGAPKLELRSLSLAGRRSSTPLLDKVDLAVRRGEVVGLFGAVGCGSDEVVKLLLGIETRGQSGVVSIDGKPVEIRSPAHALKLGVG
jgi:ribose transport system ATP-binding protein